MNFYKRHIGDYLKDTAHLSLLEHGIYTRLLDVYYTREAGIPDSQAARLIGARSKDEVEALRIVLEEFFGLVDGVWIQQRCEREIEEACAQAKANRENGKKGGRPKAKRNPTNNPPETQLKTETKPNGNPSGYFSLTEKNLSQTPDSRLQTPDVNHPLEEQSALQTELAPSMPDCSSSVSRAVEIAVYLRQRGVVGANSINPNIAQWADDARVTNEILDAAISKARASLKDGAQLGPNYLAPVIPDLLNPKPAPAKPRDDWHRSEAGIKRKARELGFGDGRANESWDSLKARCWDEIKRREAQGAAA